jgi:SM-20-related protein
MDSPRFSFGNHFDRAELARAYRDTGRIEITDFIPPEQAIALRHHLLEREDWALVVNGGDQVYDIPRDVAANFTADQRNEFEARLSASARTGFQYCYESIRVPDPPEERGRRDTLLDHFVAFMASPDACALFNAILGGDDIVFADGQATAYGPGHFLTRHDDDVAGKNRAAAYVLGLAPDWRAEWGGLLMFHRADGNIAEAFTPMMGTLRLFRVPTSHSVSYVTPFAPEPRLSVTGWLRTRPPDHSMP